MSDPTRKPIAVDSNDPRLNVMISSTTVDLPEHRAKVRDAILSMGHHPVAMEHGPAEWNSDAIKFSLEKVAQSQVYLGIFGEWYGHVPQDAVRNPDKLSVTELEYRHAVKQGIPTLLFLSHKDHAFKKAEYESDSEKRAKLDSLKAGFQASEICGFYRSPDELAALVVRALHKLIPQLKQRSDRPSLPQPPEVYAVPNYTLTNKFVGRRSEWERLDAWGKSPDAIMVVEAIGGIGKSALTWEWMQKSAPSSIPRLAGRIWWSFYERGTSMQTFVRHALAYLTNQDAETLRKGLTHHERGQMLLAELRRRPYLLVLDGFERVLTAYHRLDKAQIPDDQVETDLTKCINSTDGDLLVQLQHCRPSKILISSRLFPRELIDRGSQKPVAGVGHLHLNGLAPLDALEMIHDAGVRGDRNAMLAFAEQFGRHSLLLRIVCGLIADYPRKPYNFDAWYADPNYGGGLRLSEVALKQRNTHILHFALRDLGDKQRQLLSRIAVLPENADYKLIAVVNPYLPPRPEEVEEPSDPFDTYQWRRLTRREEASTPEERQSNAAELQDYRSKHETVAHGAKSVPSLLTAATEGVRLEGDALCSTEVEPMDFPLKDYIDEDACYCKLVELLHPDGLACPKCGQQQRLGVHNRHRAPLLDYQCGECGCVFNAWTETVLQGAHRRPSQVLLILHGVATGEPTARMARELGCDRKHLLGLRHRLQEHARRWLDRNPLGDAVVEADEMYQNAGEKGIPHDDPADPPRRRANRRRGHGTFENDRPPIAGVVGRESGEFRSEVLDHADAAELEEVIECTTLEGTVVNTDEWKGYNGLSRMKRGHKTVDHSGPKSTWARDDDGDGAREVHCNTQEGIWTHVRNFLRRFYGVSKWYLAQYQAVFQWGFAIKSITDEFLRILLGIPPSTDLAP